MDRTAEVPRNSNTTQRHVRNHYRYIPKNREHLRADRRTSPPRRTPHARVPARPSLQPSHVSQVPRLRAGRRARSGLRHRREFGHLHPPQRHRAAAAARVQRGRSRHRLPGDAGLAQPQRPRLQGLLLLRRVRRLPRPEPRLHRSCGPCLRAPGARRSRSAAPHRLRGLLQLLFPAGAPPCTWGADSSRRSAARRAPLRSWCSAIALWKGHYASDPQILGKTIVLNRGSFTVVGVAPEGFVGASILGADDLGALLRARAVEPGQELLPRRQHELARSGRPPEARRLARQRPRRPGRHRRRRGPPKPRPQDHAARRHRNLHEQSGRPRPRARRGRDDPGRGQPGAGHRLRQSRQPPAGARRRPEERDRRPPGRRRIALAPAPPVAHRESAALRRRRCSRPPGRMGNASHHGSPPDGAPPAGSPVHRPESESRYPHRALLAGPGLRHRHRLRLDSRPPGLEPRPQLGAEGVRHHHRRTLRRMAPQFARHRASRRLPGPADRRRTPGARTAVRPSHRSRIRNPRHRHRRLRSQPGRLRRTQGRGISPPACGAADRPPRHHATSRLWIPSP